MKKVLILFVLLCWPIVGHTAQICLQVPPGTVSRLDNARAAWLLSDRAQRILRKEGLTEAQVTHKVFIRLLIRQAMVNAQTRAFRETLDTDPALIGDLPGIEP